MYFFDPVYLLVISPALLLMLWAQAKVKSSYGRGMQVDARLSGAAAARLVLDRAGLNSVEIEEAQGFLTDHYDPSHRVLRLSREVYHTRTATAVGIATHEAGHAIQHATGYMPLVIRNAAVPAAQYGPTLFLIMMIAGMLLNMPQLFVVGVVAFGGLLFFQLVNLPVEFDASNRAKVLLTEYNIVSGEGADAVRRVLNAAGWTYVAATLQTLLQFLYYAWRIFGSNSDE
ncbi:MAG: zinc metallopeptidase [Rhodopirellula sp.]|nr:zinc metallopeptidase [Rhodopirellula sp.]